MLSIPTAIAAQSPAVEDLALPTLSVDPAASSVRELGDGNDRVTVKIDRPLPTDSQLLLWVNGNEVQLSADRRQTFDFTMPLPTPASARPEVLIAATTYVPDRGESLAANLIECPRDGTPCTEISPAN